MDESSLTGETTTANKDEIAMTFYETEVLPFTALLPFVNVNRVSHSLLTSPELVHQCNILVMSVTLETSHSEISRKFVFLQDEEHQNLHSASDKRNMLYSSTTVASGRCKAVVTGTSAHTEIGKIAKQSDR